MGDFMGEFKTFGEILEKEFIIPHYSNYSNFAKVSGLSIDVIEKICKGDQDISEKIATILSHSFNNSIDFWQNLQKSLNQERLDRMNLSQKKKK